MRVMKEKFKHKRPIKTKNQIYFMVFNSGYREYISLGYDLELMANNILKRYNSYCSTCDEVENLEAMAQIRDKEGYYFNTYIVELNTATDVEYQTWDNEIYLGDYLLTKL